MFTSRFLVCQSIKYVQTIKGYEEIEKEARIDPRSIEGYESMIVGTNGSMDMGALDGTDRHWTYVRMKSGHVYLIPLTISDFEEHLNRFIKQQYEQE